MKKSTNGFERRDIQKTREVIKDAREAGVDTRGKVIGQFGVALKPLIDREIDALLEANGEFIEKKWSELTRYAQGENALAFPKVRSVFEKTTLSRVKILRQTEEFQSTDFTDPKVLQGIIKGAAFDFIQMLRSAYMQGETPSQALVLAGSSHYIAPAEVGALIGEYRDKIGKNVINRALLGYRKDPKAFIDSYISTVERLTQKYSDRPLKHLISEAALYHPDDPDGYIDQKIQAIG